MASMYSLNIRVHVLVLNVTQIRISTYMDVPIRAHLLFVININKKVKKVFTLFKSVAIITYFVR